ncbi:Lipase, secreted [Ceraceosorus bombacis]|uniref:triacylglycerol lipase n=1 Tax=Ceraceosorus bombacis TaxID=401625 RepID=A0A0P1BCE2_9BASI|nr:Lipase, secreted [Ceraceosorus bombacis]
MQTLAFAAKLLAACSLVIYTFSIPSNARLLDPRQANGFVSPSVDPFYRVPANISSYKPGDVIRSRKVSTYATSAKTSYQVLYASSLANTTTYDVATDATVTTLLSPYFPAAGPMKIWGLALPIDSTGKDCQSSFSFQLGALSKAKATAFPAIFGVISNYALNKGWYVSVPDYMGSQATWISGNGEGFGMLDGVRVVANHKETVGSKSTKDAKIAIYGYSGGAHAVSWAGQLHQSYAPTLNLVGVVSGGIPVDVKQMLSQLNKGPFSGFVLGSIAGVAAATPKLQAWLDTNLNAQGRNDIYATRATGGDSQCILDLLLRNLNKDINSYFANKDWQNDPTVSSSLDENTLGYGSEGQIPGTLPQLILQSQTDEIISPPQVQSYVDSQCAGGANINYQKIGTGEHIATAFQTLPIALQWTSGVLDGTLKQSGCQTTYTPFLPLLSQNKDANKILGVDIVSALKKYQGTDFGFNGIKFK